MMNDKSVLDLASELCSILKANYDAIGAGNGDDFTLTKGSKYLKVVHVYSSGRSVHAFVDAKTGDLYKAASWAAPAKGVRFNLYRDMEVLRTRANWCGSYLYR